MFLECRPAVVLICGAQEAEGPLQSEYILGAFAQDLKKIQGSELEAILGDPGPPVAALTLAACAVSSPSSRSRFDDFAALELFYRSSYLLRKSKLASSLQVPTSAMHQLG